MEITDSFKHTEEKPDEEKPNDEDDGGFTFVHVLQDYRAVRIRRVYSPYHPHGGYLWRLLIFPRGNESRNGELSVYLECGGPVISNSKSQDTHKISRWSCPAIYFLHLVHPSRWPHEGIDIGTADAPTVSNNDVNVDIMKEAAHVFRDTEVDWGFCHFVEHNILRPGSYCDKEFNLVVKVRIRLHSYKGSGNTNGNKKMKITSTPQLKSDEEVEKLDASAGADETAAVLAAFLVNYEREVISSKSYEDIRDKLAQTFKAKFISASMFKEGNEQHVEWLSKVILLTLKEVCEGDAMVSLEFSLERFFRRVRAVI